MTDSYIYESPDGGETIYRRKFYSDKKEKVGVSKNARIKEEEAHWKEILEAAEDNPVLQNAIERVKMLYHLTKKDTDA